MVAAVVVEVSDAVRSSQATKPVGIPLVPVADGHSAVAIVPRAPDTGVVHIPIPPGRRAIGVAIPEQVVFHSAVKSTRVRVGVSPRHCLGFSFKMMMKFVK